jgi:predicted nuclease of restriction endonuclease-like RecB superfamily
MILPPDSINLSTYTPADLLRLRDRVNALLPSADIEDLDLSSELIRTFQSAKSLLESAADDDETPLSQKSAIVNSLNSLLKNLAELQKSLYSVERQQKLERALVEALKLHPSLSDSFFAEYEKEC